MNTDGSLGQVIFVKTTTKIIPPDTGAAMAWLKNRKPETWRDRKDIDITSGGDTLIDPFAQMRKNHGIDS